MNRRTRRLAKAAPSPTSWLVHAGSMLAILAMLGPAATRAQMPAFPEAEGYGAHALGGRGGRVLKVTTLEDDTSPPPVGSLRAAIVHHNAATSPACLGFCASDCDIPPCPSTIVFEVDGTIELVDELVVNTPKLTIAGQSAPGGGIALKADPAFAVADYLLNIISRDIVVRHLRIRPGVGTLAGGTKLGGFKITGENTRDIMLDHVSSTWAEDKALTIFGGAEDITVQNSVLAETLGCANHEKSVELPTPTKPACAPGAYCCEEYVDLGLRGIPHSRLITISTDEFDPMEPPTPSPDDITLHGNLLANTNKRFPNVTSDTYVKFVNNLVYNFGANGAKVHAGKHPTAHHAELDYVGNYVRTGPWTAEFSELAPAPRFAITANPPLPTFQHLIFEDSAEQTPTYSANILDTPEPGVAEIRDDGVESLVDWVEDWIRVGDEPVETTLLSNANIAYNRALWTAGAFPRDAADDRIVTETACRWGTIVDDPLLDVGGWPDLAPGNVEDDGDDDGMPDQWESDRLLDPNDPDDRNLLAPSGYTWLEEYLNERADTLVGNGQLPGDCNDPSNDLPPSPATAKAVDVLDSTRVSVDWYEARDRIGVDHYEIWANVDGGAPERFGDDAQQPPAVADELLPDETYWFDVRTVDGAGQATSATATIEARTLMAPVQDLVTRVRQRQNGTSVDVGWSAHPDAVSYDVFRDDLSDALIAGLTQTRFQDFLESCTEHTYTIEAIGSSPDPNRSEPSSIMISCP